MNVLLLEDEPLAAREMQDLLAEVAPDARLLAVLDSIATAERWLTDRGAHHPDQPELIFMDIHLADGLSFELFRRVPITCPVVFCTAYDAYALEAFHTNGVDYLLKPIGADDLRRSLDKVRALQRHFAPTAPPYEVLLRTLLQPARRYQNSFLVSYREKMMPIAVEQIAGFELTHGVTNLSTFDGQHFALPSSLEDIENHLDPAQFHRCNRQWIVARRAVLEVEPYFHRKLAVRLRVTTARPILVSKEKSTEFLRWLEGA
jgi:DNA-binding LytR/AlgR family response regulator